jgi:O-antigen ligase
VSFANVRFFSQWQAYTLPLLLIPVFDRRVARRWRVAAFLLCAHWWMLQFAVGTRAVWFAAATTFLIVALAFGGVSKRWMQWQSAAVLAGGVLYLVFQVSLLTTAPGLADVGQRGFDDSHRFALWASAVEMIREYPVLGVGPLHFGILQTKIAAHPHNSLLQIATECGIPAACLALCLIAYLLWRCVIWCRLERDDYNGGVNLCLLAGLGMGLTDSLLSGNTAMPHSQVMLVLLCGWLTGRNSPHPASVDHSLGRSRVIAHVVLSTAVLAAGMVIIAAALEYFRAVEYTGFAMPFESHPRFWQDGHWLIRE